MRVSNNLDPDHARHFVWPNLNLNCLQRLLHVADNACMFFAVCRFFSTSKLSILFVRNMIRESNSLNPDQTQFFVEPHLGSN